MGKPSMIVSTLERFIVGQKDAKRAVAIALRNRWRRQQLHESVRSEVTPKNILMVGPTGCGKTEIARRLATLAGSPFIKVEATKFTEVGFHGRDVDMIIRDLLEVGISLTKKVKREALLPQVADKVNTRLLELLAGGKGEKGRQSNESSFKRFLEKGELDHIEVTVKVPSQQGNSQAAIAFDPSNKEGVNLTDVLKNISKQMAPGKTVD